MESLRRRPVVQKSIKRTTILFSAIAAAVLYLCYPAWADSYTIPAPLRRGLCGTYSEAQAEKGYVDKLVSRLRFGRNPNALDQQDVDALNAEFLRRSGVIQVMRTLNLDLNGDGKVTKEELLANENQPRMGGDPANKIKELLAYDLNKDDVIDFDEMRHIDASTAKPSATEFIELLALAPDKKLLTAEELAKQAHTAFASLDKDHNGVLSHEECNEYIMSSVKSNKKLMEQLNALDQKRKLKHSEIK